MKAIKTISLWILSLILMGTLTSSLSAQSTTQTSERFGLKMFHLKKDTLNNDKPIKVRKMRADRKFGMQSELGFKTFVGIGLYLSYYPTTRFAVDAGVGIGAQVANLGGRFRYFLIDSRLTPYVGLGALYRPVSIDNIEFETTDGDNTSLDLNSNFFLIPQFGLEFRGDRGFIIGFNVGYAYVPNENPYTTSEPIPTVDTQILNAFFSDSLSLGTYIGFSF